ncbi:CotH kinase family protein [Fibrobacter sp. UWB12]|uniref:CotH kinase family protein n=1 Tax=Fibrobacter sp. UWB12 TaxID=1896203 RepID=UPI000919C34D|nr:CotH kinase family protein [Fibrobacter sp. UWB12]SHK57779.1 Chitobiase/beta-hexosaminidase C-terminal domain-containing protein [Fibrobacter sp. UWB12]
MQKKLVVWSLAFASVYFCGCTDDNAAAPFNDIPQISEESSSSAEQSNHNDSNSSTPAIKSSSSKVQSNESSQTSPNSESPNEETPKTSSSSAPISSSAIAPASSSVIAQLPAFSSSSYAISYASVASSSSTAIVASSSSGLKDYDDNHKPKDSFLPAAGFYSNLTINPLSPQKGGEIRCTFDGSFPTAQSEQITEAKAITENMVIRCSEFVNGQPMDTTTQTYFINENVSMPVVAITVNHHDMFDSTDGLYATGNVGGAAGGMGNWGNMGGGGSNVTDNNNPKCTEPCKGANFWRDDELPAHVEYFENGSSSKSKAWEIDAGISIIGNWSRYKPKKSVAIKMDNDIYGDKVLKYSLFKTRSNAKKFKAFNLRNNGNRFWSDYVGDAMMTALLEGTDVDYQRSRQVVVFYNGEYFGIHDMRERLNRNFVETNYGIDSKSINMIKITGTGLEASGTNGASTTEYQQLYNEISSANYAGENNAQYEQVKTKLNVNSFAQYMFAEMYFHNGDWPTNNVRAWGGNGHPFKFVAFDTDHGFGFSPGISGFDVDNQNMFDWVLGAKQNSTGNQGNQGNQGGMWGGFGGGGFGGFGGFGGGGASAGPGTMLSKLLNNPDFKRLFINNACILLNSYLTYEKVQKTVQSMMATIPSSEQQRDQQRWPRNQTNFKWDPNGNNLIAYAKNRSETIKKEMVERFDLENEVSVTIGASGNGSVLVDNMKLPNNNYQCKFFNNNELLLTAVASSGAVFTGWSDGSTENPRKVTPREGLTITAQFK